MRAEPVLQRSAPERERLQQRVAERLDGPVTALGVIFVLLVLAETITPADTPLAQVFGVAGWVLWALFVAEFVLRLVIAPSTSAFLRRNWWQLIFLALPFLRFARILARLRVARLARAGRVVSSALRGTRTAARVLSGRLAWLAALSAIVVLAASQLLYEFGGYDVYGVALHDAALATITGEPLSRDGAFADALEVVLAIYSVVVFATLAGMLGAFFLDRESRNR
jgi:voltage-gated potassium channel